MFLYPIAILNKSCIRLFSPLQYPTDIDPTYFLNIFKKAAMMKKRMK